MRTLKHFLIDLSFLALLVAIVVVMLILAIDDHRQVEARVQGAVGEYIELEATTHPMRFYVSEIKDLDMNILGRDVTFKGILEVTIPANMTFLGSHYSSGIVTINLASKESGIGESWIIRMKPKSSIGITMYIEPIDIKVINTQ